MVDAYIKKVKNKTNKFYNKMFDVDYKAIIKECILSIEKIPCKKQEEIDKIKDTIFTIILDVAFNLKRDELNNYIKILKENKIYKYKTKKINRLIMKFFLKQYILLYMIKYNKFNFFKNKKTQRKMNYLIIGKNKIKKLLPNTLYIDYIELVITTKCTLRCKNCANLMYKYNKPYDVNNDILVKSIKKITECANNIDKFRILGGEPFCNPNLKQILNAIPINKINNIIIVTNGTLIPKDPELIEILKQKKIMVEISDYNEYSFNKEKLISFLKQNKIEYQTEVNKIWYEYGDLKDYKRNKKDLEQQFLYCNINCKSILNGKLYYCPRSAHGHDLNVVKEDCYVDLINNDKKTNKKEIKKLMFKNKSIEACKYCKYATKECKIVPVAEQEKK